MAEQALLDALHAEPSELGWRAVLDELVRPADLVVAERGLARWPDSLRAAPAGVWSSIQMGSRPPVWWPLIRAVRLDDDDGLEPVAALAGLTLLDLGRQADRLDLEPLESLPRLRDLRLWGGVRTDLTPLANLAGLTHLDMPGAALLEDIAPIATLGALVHLGLRGAARLTDLNPLAGLRSLRTLLLADCTSLSDLRALAPLAELRVLEIGPAPRVASIETLAGLPQLGSLTLDAGRSGMILPPLAARHGLRRLEVTARPLAGLEPLAGLVALTDLIIDDAPSLRDLDVAAGLTALTSLRVRNAPELVDVTGLRGLPRLRTVAFVYCPALVDLDAIDDLPALVSVDLTGSRSAVPAARWASRGVRVSGVDR